MSAAPSDDDDPGHGSAAMLFEEIRLQAGLLREQATLLEMHAEIHDLFGCHYCARRAAAHARSLYGSLTDATELAIQ
jgi:hypothetical protein